MKKILLLTIVVAIVAGAAPSFAQDVPVVFVHGFRGDHHTWAGTAARLQQQLAIRPYLAQLSWQEAFETQTAQLEGQFGSLPASTIAVGHSNGGIVSRLWSMQRPLSGVLTVGTPNYGAPLIDHLHDVLNFNQTLYNVVGLAGGAFSVDPETWNFVYLWVQGALMFSSRIAIDTVWGVIGLGLQFGLPVTGQMSSSSYIIQGLNSSANVTREMVSIPHRAALLYVARNYWQAGPMRAIDPDNADAFFYGMSASVAILETAAAALSAYYPNNANAMWIANALFSAAGMVREVDPAWCWMVTNDRTCSTWHDGVVPFDHQRLSSGANIGVGGPAHTQEPREPGPLHYALTTFFNVSGRGGDVPPSASAGSDQLGAGQTLYAGQFRRSGDGRFELHFQHDGNLVLYRSDGVPLWASNTYAPGGEVAMQTDGNLVVYDAGGVAQWHSGTANYPGASLVVQTDGNVVIYDYYGYALWATGTAQ